MFTSHARPTFVILILAVCATLLAGRTTSAQLDTTLRCEPAPVNGTVGQTVSVNLYVEDVVDLYAADLDLSFDPALVQVVDALPTLDGIQIEVLKSFLSANFIIERNADNATGEIHYAATQLNPTPPVSGSGALARVTLLGLVDGESTLTFTAHKLVKPGGVEIPVETVTNCQIQFSTQGNPLFFPLVKRYK